MSYLTETTNREISRLGYEMVRGNEEILAGRIEGFYHIVSGEDEYLMNVSDRNVFLSVIGEASIGKAERVDPKEISDLIDSAKIYRANPHMDGGLPH